MKGFLFCFVFSLNLLLEAGSGGDNPALWANQDYAAPHVQIFKREKWQFITY